MDKLKQARQGRYVTGLKDVSGVKVRMDIDVMLDKRPDMFNLFVLALDRSKTGTDPMDYPRIAGIHGFPSTTWDGVPNHYNQNTGYYCTHKTQAFPTWHRPYLALLEQALALRMYEIANEFPESQRQPYLKAADDFRLPYWDYYRPRGGTIEDGEPTKVPANNNSQINVPADVGFEFPGVVNKDGTTTHRFDFSLPRVFLVEHLMVIRPEAPDRLTVMRNPLNTFRFPAGLIPDKDWEADREFSKENTRRHPDIYQSYEVSRDADLAAVLQSEREAGIVSMLNMMNEPKYSTFFHSLENLHNKYHVYIGSRGHMSDTTFAAFDPVFWFHHANIDRYLSIWQAIHPQTPGSSDTWVSATPDDKKWALDSDLVPFRRAPVSGNAKFWKSNDTYDTKALGYTYADVEEVSSPLDVKKRLWANYAWSLHKVLLPDMINTAPPAMHPLNLSQSAVFLYDELPMQPFKFQDENPKISSLVHTNLEVADVKPIAREHLSAPLVAPEQEVVKKMPQGTKRQIQWYVNVRVNSMALGGTFSIVFFLGKVNDKAKNWLTQPNSLAITHIFVGPADACSNCKQKQLNEDQTVTSTPLTPMLLDFKEALGDLDTLMPEKDGAPVGARKFLEENLHWRVRLLSPGKGLNPEVDPSALPSLKVWVSAQAQFFQPGSYLPEYGPMQDFPGITQRG